MRAALVTAISALAFTSCSGSGPLKAADTSVATSATHAAAPTTDSPSPSVVMTTTTTAAATTTAAPTTSLTPVSAEQSTSVLDPATGAYLTGPGALLVTFRTALAPLIALSDTTPAAVALPTCTAVATTLGAVNPADLLNVAAVVPDPALAELFVDERTLASKALVACGKGTDGDFQQFLTSLQNADILIGHRLGAS